jgi:hypothetical protein
MNREQITKLAQQFGLMMRDQPMHGVEALAKAAYAAGAASEREECAKACEDTTAAWTQPVYNGACMDCAAAIRARGQE